MTRILLSILAALLVLAVPAAAQTPVASTNATADPFALPGNQLIVRIRAGNGFDFVRFDDGSLATASRHPIDDGVSRFGATPWVADWLTTIRVVDMHTSLVAMVPEGATAPIRIEVRLLSFPDEAAAGAAIPAAFGSLLRQEGEVPHGAQVIGMGDQSMIEVTGFDSSLDTRTGAWGESDVPFTRLIIRHGAMVTTVKVTSADPAFNGSVAQDLIAAQLACIDANIPCVPVMLPGGVNFMPATPVASQIATQSRWPWPNR